MALLKAVEPFGQTHIPSSDHETASYSAADWIPLQRDWGIAMYYTLPGSCEPVEMPSAAFVPWDYALPRGRRWNRIVEKVLRDRSELWERLAEL
jgi:hypothetical protein